MKSPRFLAGLWLLALAPLSPLHALDVLFVGNSFTYGNGDYNHRAITDANGQGHGGLPATFKKMADEGGHADVNVTIEAIGGQTLSHHLKARTDVLGRRWDVVVLQDHSTRTFKSSAGGNVAAFRDAVKGIDALVRGANPDAKVLLFETWAHPKRVPDAYPTLAAMQDDIRAAYSQAAADFGLAGWVPVGEAYMQALESGLAYDPNDGPAEGKFNLYVNDKLHPSKHGCYLGAAVFYARILDGDPRKLPIGAGSAAAGLGIKPGDAEALQRLAWAAHAGERVVVDRAVADGPSQDYADLGALLR